MDGEPTKTNPDSITRKDILKATIIAWGAALLAACQRMGESLVPKVGDPGWIGDPEATATVLRQKPEEYQQAIENIKNHPEVFTQSLDIKAICRSANGSFIEYRGDGYLAYVDPENKYAIGISIDHILYHDVHSLNISQPQFRDSSHQGIKRTLYTNPDDSLFVADRTLISQYPDKKYPLSVFIFIIDPVTDKLQKYTPSIQQGALQPGTELTALTFIDAVAALGIKNGFPYTPTVESGPELHSERGFEITLKGSISPTSSGGVLVSPDHQLVGVLNGTLDEYGRNDARIASFPPPEEFAAFLTTLRNEFFTSLGKEPPNTPITFGT